MTETYYLISSWLESWKERFGIIEQESLRKLLFKKSFSNVARACHLALESHYLTKPTVKIQKNQKNNWGKDLLENLELFFKNKSPIIPLLKVEHKKDIENLEKELMKGSYDVSVIYPILGRVQKGLSNDFIRKEFIKELKRDSKADENKLDYLGDALIQNNLFHHGLSSLKELPEKSVARHGATLFLKNHIETLINNKPLSILLLNDFIRFISDEFPFNKTDDLFVSNPESIFKTIDTYYWNSLMRRFLKQLAELFSSEIQVLNVTGNKEKIAKKVETNKILHSKIGKMALKIYTPFLLKAVLNKLTSKPARDEYSVLSKNMLHLGDWLKENADFADNQLCPYEHRPDIVDLVITESFATSAGDFIANYLANKLSTKFDKETANNIGRRICGYFGKEIRENEFDWGATSSKKLEVFCTTWSARTVFHRNLGLIFSPANEFIVEKLPSFINSLDSHSLLNKKNQRQTFWHEWFEKFVSWASFSSYIYKHFPWKNISKPELELLFDAIFNDFTEGNEEWTAIYIVKGLNSKNKVWNIAEITFFDPETFDFGERRWFPSNIAETVTFAKINVQASSTKEAVQKGWLRLNNVLNESALILSMNRSYGGFEVDIHPDIYVAQPRTNSWSAGWSLARTDRPIQQPSVAFENWVLPTMDKLFEKEKSNLPLTELESRFVKALHWYNKGRWRRDAAETCIFYWIGIETLFGESGQEKLFSLMSQLAISWRSAYSYGFYFLKRHHYDLVKIISEDLEVKKIIDSNPQLKDWDNQYTVLFNHKKAKLLHFLIPDSEKKIKDYAQGYVENLQRYIDDESAYLKKVETMRSDFRFKLILLKDLRNRITHQGLYYNPEINLYTEELQDILENFLTSFANVAINQPPRLNRLGDLIAEFDKLWVKLE